MHLNEHDPQPEAHAARQRVDELDRTDHDPRLAKNDQHLDHPDHVVDSRERSPRRRQANDDELIEHDTQRRTSRKRRRGGDEYSDQDVDRNQRRDIRNDIEDDLLDRDSHGSERGRRLKDDRQDGRWDVNDDGHERNRNRKQRISNRRSFNDDDRDRPQKQSLISKLSGLDVDHEQDNDYRARESGRNQGRPQKKSLLSKLSGLDLDHDDHSEYGHRHEHQEDDRNQRRESGLFGMGRGRDRADRDDYRNDKRDYRNDHDDYDHPNRELGFEADRNVSSRRDFDGNDDRRGRGRDGNRGRDDHRDDNRGRRDRTGLLGFRDGAVFDDDYEERGYDSRDRLLSDDDLDVFGHDSGFGRRRDDRRGDRSMMDRARDLFSGRSNDDYGDEYNDRNDYSRGRSMSHRDRNDDFDGRGGAGGSRFDRENRGGRRDQRRGQARDSRRVGFRQEDHDYRDFERDSPRQSFRDSHFEQEGYGRESFNQGYGEPDIDMRMQRQPQYGQQGPMQQSARPYQPQHGGGQGFPQQPEPWNQVAGQLPYGVSPYEAGYREQISNHPVNDPGYREQVSAWPNMGMQQTPHQQLALPPAQGGQNMARPQPMAAYGPQISSQGHSYSNQMNPAHESIQPGYPQQPQGYAQQVQQQSQPQHQHGFAQQVQQSQPQQGYPQQEQQHQAYPQQQQHGYQAQSSQYQSYQPLGQDAYGSGYRETYRPQQSSWQNQSEGYQSAASVQQPMQQAQYGEVNSAEPTRYGHGYSGGQQSQYQTPPAASPGYQDGYRDPGIPRPQAEAGYQGQNAGFSAHKTYPKPQGAPIFIDPAFLRDNPSAGSILDLFNFLPDVVFFAKDRESRFVAANEAMLQTKNLSDPSTLLGRTDYDFFPPALAGIHLEEDRHVMESGEALSEQIWFKMDRNGRPRWFSSSKTPFRNSSGQIVGVVGFRHTLESEDALQRQFKKLYPVIQHLERHFREPFSPHQLAQKAGMTQDELNREFADMIGMSPQQFLPAFRIEKARQLLACTARTISEIAKEAGFRDEEDLNQHFGRWNGMEPNAYRERFRTVGSPTS